MKDKCRIRFAVIIQRQTICGEPLSVLHSEHDSISAARDMATALLLDGIEVALEEWCDDRCYCWTRSKIARVFGRPPERELSLCAPRL